MLLLPEKPGQKVKMNWPQFDLLEQKHIACNWDPTCGLTMRSILVSQYNTEKKKNSVRIWKWNPFIVSEVWSIVNPLSALHCAGDFSYDIRRSFVGTRHVRSPGTSMLPRCCTEDARGNSLQWMLGNVHLVAVGR
jgi:hypothetical protein